MRSIYRNGGQYLLAAVLVLSWASAEAAPKRYSYDEENNTLLREMRDSLDEMRHEVKNHEAEIRVFEEKLASQESIIDGLRQQQTEATQASKELLKGNSANLETKIISLETSTKGLVADMRQLKAHANDTADVLSQYKKKLSELERLIELQNHNLDNLQAAMRSLMDAMQAKVVSEKPAASTAGSTEKTADGTKIYRVKAGDSLEKIARSNQTTTQILKELNGLTSDRIIIGQAIKLP